MPPSFVVTHQYGRWRSSEQTASVSAATAPSASHFGRIAVPPPSGSEPLCGENRTRDILPRMSIKNSGCRHLGRKMRLTVGRRESGAINFVSTTSKV
jgi:hypothetical protein